MVAPLDSANVADFARLGWASVPGFFKADEIAQIARWTD